MKHFGVCKFCGKKTTLIKSHIIPKCFYHINKHGGMTKFDLINSTIDFKHYQNGYKEYLLCAECDNKLGELDNYAYNILYNIIPNQKLEIDEDIIPQYLLKYPLFNFYKLRHFFISLIWRKSISNIDPKHLGAYESIALRILKNEQVDNPSLFLPVIYRKNTNIVLDAVTNISSSLSNTEYWFKFANYEILIIIDTNKTKYYKDIEVLKKMFTSNEIKIPLISGYTKLDLSFLQQMQQFKNRLISIYKNKSISKN